MKHNVGACDRAIRMIAGIALGIFAWYGLQGTWQMIAYVVSAILIIVSIVRFCPLYPIFGIDSSKCSCKMCCKDGSCKTEASK